jgi:ADP-ribosyl-[dinitrogen reductase] hydrolase
MTTPRIDRGRGALLGLAVGDALGASVEFKSPGTFPPVRGYRDGGPHGLAPGEWTDDTSMALALADSLRSTGWDLTDQATRYVSWFRTGAYSVTGSCFDIGITTSAALRRFEATGDPRTSGPADERSAGNGSIMRLAPVPIAYAHRLEDAPELVARRSVESSLPTHRAPQALAACAWMGTVLAGLIEGATVRGVCDPGWPPASVARTVAADDRIDAVVTGSYVHPATRIVGSGYVVKSLEAALWALTTTNSFEDAVLAAVNLGDDADTTGAVCGQLAGAAYGLAAIPTTLVEGLARHDEIMATADDLLATGPA